ncbi:MAG: hypothetical protein FWF44_08790 [Defluviitaleaceae bacterium]|nr:hypothetical protein [Defluviitaleaceae bacterium]
MINPAYYKAERFFPTKKYEEFSMIFNKHEIITYDILLCNSTNSRYGEVQNLTGLVGVSLKTDEQIIAYYENPNESYESHYPGDGFEFCGYDLCEKMTGISAITNCGGDFEKAIPYNELNQYGLIGTYESVRKSHDALISLYPSDNHANCEIYELWRKLNV